MKPDDYIDLRNRIEDVLEGHWWPDFTKGDGGFFTHYCRSCQRRFTRPAFTSHLRDLLIEAIGEAS